jgi:hypothetical protein
MRSGEGAVALRQGRLLNVRLFESRGDDRGMYFLPTVATNVATWQHRSARRPGDSAQRAPRAIRAEDRGAASGGRDPGKSLTRDSPLQLALNADALVRRMANQQRR